jgi:ubiquinol-cytochrome c reductase iron-sulfur subunit
MACPATETIAPFEYAPPPPDRPVAETHPAAETTPPAHAGPKRDFLKMTLAATSVVGICMAIWPFLDTMDPSHIVVTNTQVAVNLGGIPAGSGATVIWKGEPILIRHRTPAEITRDQNVNVLQLRDPASDLSRAKTGYPEWVVLFGAGTDGCVVVGNTPADPRGQFGGWISPCDGSQYDTAGRIRSGPARRNLRIPPYDVSSPTTITIG